MTLIHQVVRSEKNSFMSKDDLCDAYMLLTVNVKQWPLQVQKVCGSYFVNLKQMYGDTQACHQFLAPDTSLLVEYRESCGVCVYMTLLWWPRLTIYTTLQFDARYEEVCSKLGLATKGHDSSGKKAFRTLQYSLDTSNLKLTLVTLKAAQRVVGKLLDISSIWLLHCEASNYKVPLVSTCDIIFVSRLQHLILNAPILLRGCLIATVSS